MKYHIIQNENDFKSSKQIWERLYESCGCCTVFQTFEWNYEWWLKGHREDQLFIIVFFKKNIENPIAIFPLIIDEKNILRFIADIHTDFSKILSTDLDIADMYDISKIFFNLFNNCSCKSIELKNINQDDALINYLQLPFDNKKIFFQSNGYSYLEITPVKDNFFNSFSHLKSKRKSELKRIYKKYSGYTSSILTANTDTFPLDDIKSISNEMTKNGLREETFLDSTLLEIIYVLYEKDNLIIQTIQNSRGESVAMNFVLKSPKERYIFWIDIYKNFQYINIFSYITFMKTIIESSDKQIIFDFGRGLYDYKIKNFLPIIKQQYTFFFSKYNFDFLSYLSKFFAKKSIMNFYKKNKILINKLIKR
ncbi:hypothetical protein NNO_0450 [Hydrogenimonas sp.]|nr:hypothetical protein NNO_0450 [Hydrogenimonas sp.]